MEIGKELRGVAVSYFRILSRKRVDCSVLKIYAEKAKRADPNQSKEISSEFESVCKK